MASKPTNPGVVGRPLRVACVAPEAVKWHAAAAMNARPKPHQLLVLATNPVEGASTRFRIEQWRGCLAEAGFELQLDAYYSEAAQRIMYRSGHHFTKLWAFLVGAVRRYRTLRHAPRTADIILVHREAFPFGWRLLSGRLREFPGPIVYDFDDAMFLPQRLGRGLFEWWEGIGLETPAEIMRLSQTVLAGNPFLAEYARRYSTNVVLMPTCIDTSVFRPAATQEDESTTCTVGWIGSHTTAKYLEGLMPVLEQVAAKHPYELKVVGSRTRLSSIHVQVRQEPWALEREVADFQSCHIGVYPLWDDDWSRGKSGFKAIQFMACGVPVIADPVGVTREIIQDGVNGFLASNEDEWVEKLERLLTSPDLRREFGNAGRRTVEQRYSVSANAPVLVAALRSSFDRHAATSEGARREVESNDRSIASESPR